MTTMPSPDFVATCWTSAGPASPQDSDPSSPVPLEARIAAAAAAGFQGFGIVLADLRRFTGERPLSDLKRILDDHGMRHVEVELIENWWSSGAPRAASDAARHELLAAAEALGARNVKVGPDTEHPPAHSDEFIEPFERLATEAAEHGTRIALEFLPWATHLNSLEAGAALVAEVDNPAAGLCVDIWHVARAGTPYELIPELLSPRNCFVVELNDAAPEVVGSLYDDTVHRRLLPGEGSFRVPEFIEAVQGAGFDGPWGVEMLSDAARAQPVERTLADARDAALACFARSE